MLGTSRPSWKLERKSWNHDEVMKIHRDGARGRVTFWGEGNAGTAPVLCAPAGVVVRVEPVLDAHHVHLCASVQASQTKNHSAPRSCNIYQILPLLSGSISNKVSLGESSLTERPGGLPLAVADFIPSKLIAAC
jgi:hypothetical protein